MNSKITPEYLSELRKLANAATPGPWVQDIMGWWKVYGPDAAGLYINLSFHDGLTKPFSNANNDASFIAASRAAIPALIGYIEKLEAMMPHVCNTCQHFKNPQYDNQWGCVFENSDGSLELYKSIKNGDCINDKWQLKEVK